eukprot:1158516-Pelagomonas_calceolata.AAC.2
MTHSLYGMSSNAQGRTMSICPVMHKGAKGCNEHQHKGELGPQVAQQARVLHRRKHHPAI